MIMSIIIIIFKTTVENVECIEISGIVDAQKFRLFLLNFSASLLMFLK